MEALPSVHRTRRCHSEGLLGKLEIALRPKLPQRWLQARHVRKRSMEISGFSSFPSPRRILAAPRQRSRAGSYLFSQRQGDCCSANLLIEALKHFYAPSLTRRKTLTSVILYYKYTFEANQGGRFLVIRTELFSGSNSPHDAMTTSSSVKSGPSDSFIRCLEKC